MTLTSFLRRQGSNLGLGIGLVWVVCALVYVVGGEVPVRAHAGSAIALIYITSALLFDVKFTVRSVEDFLFVVVYGACGTLLAFREIVAGDDSVSFDILGPVPIVGAFCAHVLIRLILAFTAALASFMKGLWK